VSDVVTEVEPVFSFVGHDGVLDFMVNLNSVHGDVFANVVGEAHGAGERFQEGDEFFDFLDGRLALSHGFGEALNGLTEFL